MKIYSETSLDNFDTWNGATYTMDKIRELGAVDELENIIENDIFPDGCSETELNDFLWFEDDFIAELLGYDSWENLENKLDGNDDDDDDDDKDDEDNEDGWEKSKEILEKNLADKKSFDDFCSECSNCDLCDKCPLNEYGETADDCEEAYNKMLNN